MILTGPELSRQVKDGRIVIDPFDESQVEPNSYGFRLGRHIISYRDALLDARRQPSHAHHTIPDSGLELRPGNLYLGSTAEVMGSDHYAATLYARRSVSTLGMWIQFSAPLGHTGAIIAWTLEIRVAAPLTVYPGMLVGKIAFWVPVGDQFAYTGRYRDAVTTVPSLLAADADLSLGAA